MSARAAPVGSPAAFVEDVLRSAMEKLSPRKRTVPHLRSAFLSADFVGGAVGDALARLRLRRARDEAYAQDCARASEVVAMLDPTNTGAIGVRRLRKALVGADVRLLSLVSVSPAMRPLAAGGSHMATLRELGVEGGRGTIAVGDFFAWHGKRIKMVVDEISGSDRV